MEYRYTKTYILHSEHGQKAPIMFGIKYIDQNGAWDVEITLYLPSEFNNTGVKEDDVRPSHFFICLNPFFVDSMKRKLIDKTLDIDWDQSFYTADHLWLYNKFEAKNYKSLDEAKLAVENFIGSTLVLLNEVFAKNTEEHSKETVEQHKEDIKDEEGNIISHVEFDISTMYFESDGKWRAMITAYLPVDKDGKLHKVFRSNEKLYPDIWTSDKLDSSFGRFSYKNGYMIDTQTSKEVDTADEALATGREMVKNAIAILTRIGLENNKELVKEHKDREHYEIHYDRDRRTINTYFDKCFEYDPVEKRWKYKVIMYLPLNERNNPPNILNKLDVKLADNWHLAIDNRTKYWPLSLIHNERYVYSVVIEGSSTDLETLEKLANETVEKIVDSMKDYVNRKEKVKEEER